MTPPIPPPPPDDGHTDAPPRDELDALLREWHAANADRARAGRDRLLAALAAEPAPGADKPSAARDAGARSRSPVIHVIRRTLMNRYSPMAAAALIALALLVSMLIPATTPPTYAQEAVVMAPDGGRLDALDEDGNILGPCELTRTDVDVHISGFLTRVTLRQQYRNPHPDKIEAVYTFPMSHRAAVDKMTMIIGDRVIVGDVKEREAARQIYESARAQGRVASLLEQERPNIFTQSVANIEPGAEIDIEISYVEVLEPSEGRYTFSFPTVVGPRYIPGASSASEGAPLPPWLAPRPGLVLLAPGTVTITSTGDGVSAVPAAHLARLLATAHPSHGKGQAGKAPPRHPPRPWHEFTVTYPDGSAEHGALDADGTGHVGGRCFWFDPALAGRDAAKGGGFSPNTDQVPDASKITPMPVKPPMRAGHDIGITVTIDTGGPAIADFKAPLHDVIETVMYDNASLLTIALKDQDEIPNRDFVLSWSLAGDTVQESIFTHNGEHGGFFTLILQPPARVAPEQAVPRELVFVLDTSGSMRGFPIEKAKEVMSKSIESMRERDTFNIITFSGDTRILWERPRPNTPENRAEAQSFLASRHGGGGTEMMKAIEAALRQAPAEKAQIDVITLNQLVDLPADGREVCVEWPQDIPFMCEEGDHPCGASLAEVRPGLWIRYGVIPSPTNQIDCPVGEPMLVTGIWSTVAGERCFRPTAARWKNGTDRSVQPLRLVTFFTDGYVGNDMAIIDAIRKNRATTRVFSFGIGDSVNRYLLDNMARAGAGEAEYVLLTADADEVVERFTRRISTPVLANINVAFSEGLKVADVLPGPEDGGFPDLFDQRPLVIHGRYTAPGAGTVTITGVTGAGPYARTIDLNLPAAEPANDTIATLWAREKVESLMNRDLAAAQRGVFPAALRQEVVTLGETFNIMTQFTSFVAVDMARVTIAGEPRLVSIPIEMPQGVSWEGIFGGDTVVDIAVGDGAATPGEEDADFFGRRTRLDVPVAGVPIELVEAEGRADMVRRSLGKPAATLREQVHTMTGVDAGPAPETPGSKKMIAPPPTSSPPPAPVTAGFPAEADEAQQAGQRRGRDLSDDAEESVQIMEERLGSVAMESAAPGSPAADARQRSAGYPFEQVRLALRGKDDEPQRAVVVPPEAVVVRIAELAEAEKLREAAKLAAEFAEVFKEDRTAQAIAETLRNEAIDTRTRIAEVRKLAEPARARLAETRRLALLRARLDPALLPFAERADLPDTLDARYRGDKPEGATWKDGGVLVTILVEKADDAAAGRITALGARIEDSSASTNVIVAIVPLGRLDDLALLEGVRRVEPTRFSNP